MEAAVRLDLEHILAVARMADVVGVDPVAGRPWPGVLTRPLSDTKLSCIEPLADAEPSIISAVVVALPLSLDVPDGAVMVAS